MNLLLLQEEISRKWLEHPACNRIESLESYCQARGSHGQYSEQNIPAFLRETIANVYATAIADCRAALPPLNSVELYADNLEEVEIGWDNGIRAADVNLKALLP